MDLPSTEPKDWTIEEIGRFLNGLAFRMPTYPAGTTLEEAIAFHSSVIGAPATESDFVAACDACGEVVSGLRPFGEFTHKCKACDEGFVLCGPCAASPELEHSRCPRGYGCGEGAPKKEEYPMVVLDAMIKAIQDRLAPRQFTRQDLIDWFQKIQTPTVFSAAA